ncbi:MAG TPA: hypothetical protein PLI95_19980 [Polyangiaceae bacterium]|nr:hypothetical protein [Polyangiaceae bacterium]
MERSALVFITVVGLLGCSNSSIPTGESEGGHPAPSTAQMPPELVAIASRPLDPGSGFIEDSYGLESGEIGVPECDALIGALSACARSAGEKGDALGAMSKHHRLVWKLAARRKARDPDGLRGLAQECRSAAGPLRASMEELGCRGDWAAATKEKPLAPTQ